jgi:membrane associated rhomboid family serine protease
MIILIIAGLSVESRIGSWKFLIIFIVSAIFAAFFDVVNRSLFDISASVPFVGASGAVFGLLFVATFLNPFGKVPFGVIFATLLPYFGLIPSLGFFTEPIFLVFLALVLIALTSYAIPFSIPLIFSMAIFILTWLVSVFIRYPVNISSLGHLGGALGGIISFLLLCWPKKDITEESYK